jgi:hypothetical protein
MYKAKLTNWSTKTEEANQKYRQMKNKAYVSFAEGQAWLYNHCAASFESSDKATIQAYEPATFVAELHTDAIIKQTKRNSIVYTFLVSASL